MTVIFVFGSNEAGIHGKGAAKDAYRFHGAVWGCGVGHYGESYAIPTKDTRIRTLPLSDIKHYVAQFKRYAGAHPELVFKVTRIGCGLAGYTNEIIAPMFIGSSPNCLFDKAWEPIIGNENGYWN